MDWRRKGFHDHDACRDRRVAIEAGWGLKGGDGVQAVATCVYCRWPRLWINALRVHSPDDTVYMKTTSSSPTNDSLVSIM
jgi:hypothetical protein